MIHLAEDSPYQHVLFVWQQMRYLFCKRLAACLCMRKRSSSSVEPPLVYKKVWNVDVSNSSKDLGLKSDDLTASSTKSAEHEETKTLLKRMCHLLEVRVYKEEEQSYEDNKENEMKKDWMLAAAVLDRICAVAITVIYVVGTVYFFVAFKNHS